MTRLHPALGEIVEHAHGAASLTDFRSATLGTLRRHFAFDSAIFFSTAGTDRGQPGSFNKPPEAPAIFQHYQANRERYREVIERGRLASQRERAYIDTDIFSLRERRSMPFFAEILRPQKITTRIMAHLDLRGHERSVVQLCRHGRGRPFARRELDVFRELVPFIALADGTVALAPSLPDLVVPARERLFDLTARERQIVTHVRYGYTNREIATLLGTSVHTVRNQLAAVFDKLGVATRSELAAWVTRAEHRDERW